MKPFFILLFFFNLLTSSLYAQWEYTSISSDKITDEQAQVYLQGSIEVYASIMGEELVKMMFPKVLLSGRDILEIRKNNEYFGHVFFELDESNTNDSLCRVGMFGLGQKDSLSAFSDHVQGYLFGKYENCDLACSCPENVMNTLGKIIVDMGFKEDESVASDPETYKKRYGIDLSKEKYVWFRLNNTRQQE